MADNKVGSTLGFCHRPGIYPGRAVSGAAGLRRVAAAFRGTVCRCRPAGCSTRRGILQADPFLQARLDGAHPADILAGRGASRCVPGAIGQSWGNHKTEGLDILYQGLSLAAQQLPLPFLRRTFIEFVLPGRRRTCMVGGTARRMCLLRRAGQIFECQRDPGIGSSNTQSGV